MGEECERLTIYMQSRVPLGPGKSHVVVLVPVYTTRQRNFALYVTGVIFTCTYFKFGLNTTGLSRSHFRNLSACSITTVIEQPTHFTKYCQVRRRLIVTLILLPNLIYSGMNTVDELAKETSETDTVSIKAGFFDPLI